jgi:hypothetical protein
MTQKKRKVGRPKLPKGEAKGRIVPIRFAASEIRAVESAAGVSKQSVSEWIRAAVRAGLQQTLSVANRVEASHTANPRRIRKGLRNFASESESA